MQFNEETYQRLISKVPEGGGLVFFDGSCVLCNSAVAYLLKKDKNRLLCFATFSSEILRNKNVSSFVSEFPESIVYVDENGIYTESDAVLKISRLTGSFPVLRQLGLMLPKIFRDAIYRMVARYRYRWFGKTSQCIIPSASDADRFFE